MFVVGTTLALALAAVSAVPPVPVVPDPPATVRILAANGSGCRSDDVTANTLPDNGGLSITYGSLRAHIGPGAGPLDSRRNCGLLAQVVAPAGWTWAVATIVQRGAATVPAGATASSRFHVYTSGSAATLTAAAQVRGPWHDWWMETTHVDPAERVYARCDEAQSWNFGGEVRVPPRAAQRHEMILDNVEYRFSWRRCPA
jgi:hypothetical protein